VGVLFDSTGLAPVTHVYFSRPSALYHTVLESNAMKDAGIVTLEAEANKNAFKNAMASTPVNQTRTFTVRLIGNVGPDSIRFEFSKLPPYPADQDLGLAMHFVTLENALLRVTLRKISTDQFEVADAEIVDSGVAKARVWDTYDWRFPLQPVAVQAGYNALGEAGHVFKTTIFIAGPLTKLVGYYLQ
jgi:hypothetical protein